MLRPQWMKYLMAAQSSCSKAIEKPKVLVIAGTTSVGKTDLSLRLASLLNGEIISADSVQVFRWLDIGSAKVSEAEAAGVRHHLLDVADIEASEAFTVADFATLAAKAIEDIVARGRVPLVVGGTGLYLRTLLQGGPAGSPPSTSESKAMVNRIVENEDGGDWDTSMSRLKDLDPVYADTLSCNDWYRLKRALEICIVSGRPVSSFKKTLEDRPYECKCLFLSMPRVELFQRIDARCEAIIEAGLVQEVVELVKQGKLKMESQAGRSVGYRQALEFLQLVWGFPSSGKEDGMEPYSLKVKDHLGCFYDFLQVYKCKTRQLAQTQLTWFKKEPSFQWLNMSPGGVRLHMDVVAGTVARWFTAASGGEPWLVPEWDGTHLQSLTPAEKKTLREYSSTHSKPQTYADTAKVMELISDVERLLRP